MLLVSRQQPGEAPCRAWKRSDLLPFRAFRHAACHAPIIPQERTLQQPLPPSLCQCLLYACGALSRFNRSCRREIGLSLTFASIPSDRSLITTPNHSNLQVSIVKFQNPMVTCYAPVLRGLGMEHSSSQGFSSQQTHAKSRLSHHEQLCL